MVEGLRAFPSIAWIKARVSPEVFAEITCVDHMVIPDYLDDLNAMAEAEESLSHEQVFRYDRVLKDLFERVPWRDDETAKNYGWHASAPQRAEAFLRTLGLWETPATNKEENACRVATADENQSNQTETP